MTARLPGTYHAQCVQCDRAFEAHAKHHKYCSTRCAQASRKGTYYPPALCKTCEAPFKRRTTVHLYCSVKCRVAAIPPTPSLSQTLGIPTGTIGALNELRVCVDLMQRGYHVFRAMSPSCPCDLMAWAPDGKMLTIEVKTGYERTDRNGQIYTPTIRRNVFDVLAVVMMDRIIYRPLLEDVGAEHATA